MKPNKNMKITPLQENYQLSAQTSPTLRHSPNQAVAAGALVATVVPVAFRSLAADPAYQAQRDADGYQQQNATDGERPVIRVRAVQGYVLVGGGDGGARIHVDLMLQVSDSVGDVLSGESDLIAGFRNFNPSFFQRLVHFLSDCVLDVFQFFFAILHGVKEIVVFHEVVQLTHLVGNVRQLTKQKLLAGPETKTKRFDRIFNSTLPSENTCQCTA
jgi:hypothetical protein